MELQILRVRFIAGLIISRCENGLTSLESRFDTISYLLLSPVFFASIGLKVVLPDMSAAIVRICSCCRQLWQCLSESSGVRFGRKKLCGYQNYQARRIGVGMVFPGVRLH